MNLVIHVDQLFETSTSPNLSARNYFCVCVMEKVCKYPKFLGNPNQIPTSMDRYRGHRIVHCLVNY